MRCQARRPMSPHLRKPRSQESPPPDADATTTRPQGAAQRDNFSHGWSSRKSRWVLPSSRARLTTASRVRLDSGDLGLGWAVVPMPTTPRQQAPASESLDVCDGAMVRGRCVEATLKTQTRPRRMQ